MGCNLLKHLFSYTNSRFSSDILYHTKAQGIWQGKGRRANPPSLFYAVRRTLRTPRIQRLDYRTPKLRDPMKRGTPRGRMEEFPDFPRHHMIRPAQSPSPSGLSEVVISEFWRECGGSRRFQIHGHTLERVSILPFQRTLTSQRSANSHPCRAMLMLRA